LKQRFGALCHCRGRRKLAFEPRDGGERLLNVALPACDSGERLVLAVARLPQRNLGATKVRFKVPRVDPRHGLTGFNQLTHGHKNWIDAAALFGNNVIFTGLDASLAHRKGNGSFGLLLLPPNHPGCRSDDRDYTN
jgi:hypothetical protein